MNWIKRLFKRQNIVEPKDPQLNIAVIDGSAMPDIMAKITRKMMEAEENVLKDVLRNLLKREPALEDAKELHKYQQEGEFDKYFLAYKNLKLGTVYRNYNIEGKKMGVEFVPFETKDFLEPATNKDGTKVTF